MKKVSTAAAKQSRNFSQQQSLTIGLDLGDRSSCYCILEETGRIVVESKVSTSPNAIKAVFEAMPHSRIALETGTHSPWVSRLLSGLGREVIVAHTRNVRLIGESRRKDESPGCADAGTAGADRSPVAVSGEASQCESAGGSDGVPGASRTGASADGTGEHGTRAGEVLWRAAARVQRAQHESGKADGLSPELQTAPQPLLAVAEVLSEQIREYNERIECLAEESYPQTELLKQVKGCRHTDRADVLADTGRRAPFSQEPRRRLLSGNATRAKKLPAE